MIESCGWDRKWTFFIDKVLLPNETSPKENVRETNYSVPLFIQTIYNERGEERRDNNNDGRRSKKQKSFCRFLARQLRLSA